MKLSIIDAQHTIFSGAVSEAILPASGGELAILDYHEPAFVALQRGSIKLKLMSQKIGRPEANVQENPAQEELERSFFVRQGVARMKRNELIILVE